MRTRGIQNGEGDLNHERISVPGVVPQSKPQQGASGVHEPELVKRKAAL